MEYPVLIIRIDDKAEFIHLGEGMYRTKWGIMNGSISKIPFTTFGKNQFVFYYESGKIK